MAYSVHICVIGCTADCIHGHACMVGSFGGDLNHPHFDANQMHEWNGARGKCRIYTPDDGLEPVSG